MADWRHHWRAWFRHDDWNIGIVEAPIARFLEPDFEPEIHWLPEPPRSCYRADPFALPGEGGLRILHEHYDLSRGRGKLCQLTADAAGWRSEELTGFDAGRHLSYPYPIEFEGGTWCLPECWQAGEIRLYRKTGPDRHWQPDRVLVGGFAGVDSTVFFHGAHWWLACTHQHAGPQSDLWLFHAPHLLGPWRPHARNPVKRDAGSARPAGTPFWHEGHLYRPGQDCSRTYGGGIALNRIVRLDPDQFVEVVVRRLRPKAGSGWPCGLHTLAAAGGRTLVDGKRIRFQPGEFRRQWRRVRSASGTMKP